MNFFKFFNRYKQKREQEQIIIEDNSIILSKLLKEKTREAHEVTEESDFNKSLMNGTLPIEKYGTFLECLFQLIQSLEFQMKTRNFKPLEELLNNSELKSPLIARDLIYSGYNFPSSNNDLSEITNYYARVIRKLYTNHELIGLFYVFEGSTLGGKVIKKELSKRVDEEGLNYLSVYGNNIMSNWRKIIGILDSQNFSKKEKEAVIEGAVFGFKIIGQLQNFIHIN